MKSRTAAKKDTNRAPHDCCELAMTARTTSATNNSANSESSPEMHRTSNSKSPPPPTLSSSSFSLASSSSSSSSAIVLVSFLRCEAETETQGFSQKGTSAKRKLQDSNLAQAHRTSVGEATLSLISGAPLLATAAVAANNNTNNRINKERYRQIN